MRQVALLLANVSFFVGHYHVWTMPREEVDYPLVFLLSALFLVLEAIYLKLVEVGEL